MRAKKKVKKFKAGESAETLAHFTRTAVDEITGDNGFAESPVSIRVTVEVVGVQLSVGPILEVLGLTPAREAVDQFLEYRRAEKRRPIGADVSLKRILTQFKDDPDGLKASVTESMAQGWTGLFPSKVAKSRAMPSGKGGSIGGEW